MIIIQSCGAKKKKKPSPAWKMYEGSYFLAGLNYARSVVPLGNFYIISAKYGLIKATDLIYPYNAVMGTSTQIITRKKIAEQVESFGIADKKVLLIGGSAYFNALRPSFSNLKCLSDIIEDGKKGMGYQIQFLNRNRGKILV